MVNEYIENNNAIILAVTPANADFVNSESLKLARTVDPTGERTLCVLTKLDIMDKGTDASDVFAGNIIPVKLGIVGVVMRSQEDIVNKKTMEDCSKDEHLFFCKHYPKYASKCGIKYLSEKLHEVKSFCKHICMYFFIIVFQNFKKRKVSLYLL